MEFNKKVIISLFIVLFVFSVAQADIVNGTLHESIWGDSPIYTDIAIVLPNGTERTTPTGIYDGTEGYLFRIELEENGTFNSTHDPYYLDVCFLSPDLSEDDDSFYIKCREYKVYSAESVEQWLGCLTTDCIVLSSSNNESFDLDLTPNEVMNILDYSNQSSGFDVFDNINALFGTLYFHADIYNDSGKTGSDIKSSSLNTPAVHVGDLIGLETSLTGDIATSTTITYDVLWKSIYHPYDIGVAMVSNDSNIANIKTIGVIDDLTNLNSSATNSHNIILERTHYNFTNENKIADMKITGGLDSDDYTEVLVVGNTYSLLFYQQLLNRDNQLSNYVIGFKDFTYNPSNLDQLLNVKKFTFDLEGHVFFNVSHSDIWLSVYNLNVDTLIANGQLQTNFLDATIYCINETDDNLINLDYSVWTDDNEINRFLIRVDNIDTCLDEEFFIAHGSDNVITSNANYIPSKEPRLETCGNACGNFDADLMSLQTSDNVFLEIITTGAQSGGTVNMSITQDDSNFQTYDFQPSTWRMYNRTSGSFWINDADKFFYAVSNGSIYYENWTVPQDASCPSSDCESVSWMTPTKTYMVSVRKSGTAWTSSSLNYSRIHFNSNIWSLTADTSVSETELSLSEVSFNQVSEQEYEQNLLASTTTTTANLKIEVDGEPMEFRILDPLQQHDLNYTYLLPIGEHKIVVTLTALAIEKRIERNVHVSESNITQTKVFLKESTSTDLDEVTEATEFTQGSLSQVISDLLTSLFGSWSVAPYIIALGITLFMAWLTRNSGITALTMVSSLFIFSAMEWITGTVGTILIGTGLVVAFYLIYVSFIKVGGEN